MKKIRYFILFVLLMIPFTCKASMNCSTPGTVESGESFGVTYYGSISGNAPIWFAKLGNEGNAYYLSGSLSVDGEETSDFSRTIYFTAGDPGTATFYAYDVDVASDSDSFSDSNSCSVEIVSATRPNNNNETGTYYDYDEDEENEVVESKSNDNYLKSLNITDVKLNPAFNKDTLKYTAVVDEKVSKINIKAEKNSDKANLTGDGEKQLKEGTNKFEIVVTAENGETKVYEITITKKESTPIEVIIDKKRYTIVKKIEGLKIPEGFKETKITINKEEVTAYNNSSTGYLIIALMDEDGKIAWYKYNQKNETYTRYSEISSNKVRIILLTPDKKDIPYGYKKCTFLIDDEEVEGYALELNSQYRLVYGVNISTEEQGFYLFDMGEKTFQRFYNTQVEIYRDLSKKLEICIIGLVSLLIIVFVIIIANKITKKKNKKVKNEEYYENKVNEIPEEEKIEEKKSEEIKKEEFTEDTLTIENTNELSKKDRKKREKEIKKQMAEERRKFLD